MHAGFIPLLAAVNKHHVAGIIGMIVGALILIVGGVRVVTRASEGFLIPLAGVVILVLGVLTYFRTI